MARFLSSLLLLMLAAAAAFAADTVYRSVDEQGNPVFTDTPERAPGQQVERVDLPDYSTYSPPETARPTVRLSPPDALPDDALPERYRVTLLEPGPGATIRSNPGTLEVTAQVAPPVPAGHQLEVLLDGQVRARESGVGPQVRVQLDAVDRGEHQLRLRVVDASGTVLGESTSHTLYMQRISLLSPARRNAN